MSSSTHILARRMFYWGAVCCGKNPAANAMEYKMMARSPRCTTCPGSRVPYSSGPPLLLGYRGPSNVGLPAKAAAPGWVCCAHQLLQLKAELPCASAAITSSPSLQPQDDCSIRSTSPLLMCVDEMPAPALPPALTHQPTPQLQVSSPGHDGGEPPAS